MPSGDPIAKFAFTTAAASAAAGHTKDSGAACDPAVGSGWTDATGAPLAAPETLVRAAAGVEPRLDSMIHLQYKTTAMPVAAESS